LDDQPAGAFVDYWCRFGLIPEWKYTCRSGSYLIGQGFIWLACPLLLFWISRAWLIAHRGHMHDDPIVFALKDRLSWVIVALFVAVFVLAKVVS